MILILTIATATPYTTEGHAICSVDRKRMSWIYKRNMGRSLMNIIHGVPCNFDERRTGRKLSWITFQLWMQCEETTVTVTVSCDLPEREEALPGYTSEDCLNCTRYFLLCQRKGLEWVTSAFCFLLTNLVLVHIINQCTSRDPKLMRLVR